MPRLVEITVQYDGSVPGLAEHRLSLEAFGPALQQLLRASKRIATSLAVDAVEPEYGRKGGRLAKQAEQLDVQLEAIEEGSVRLRLVLALGLLAGEQMDLFADLPRRVGDAVLEAIEHESKGEPRSYPIRQYLRALPSGLQKQSYLLRDSGVEIRSFSVDSQHLPELPEELPHLVEVETEVTGVGFPPGRSEVRVLSNSLQMPLEANQEQVDKALAGRNRPVRVLAVVQGRRARLLSLTDATQPRWSPSEPDRERLLFQRWSSLLERLAR